MIGLVLSALLATAPATAQEDDEQPESSVGSRRLPPLERHPESQNYDEFVRQFHGRDYEHQAYWAEEQLGMAPEQAHDIRAGLEMIYLRNYNGARDHFEALDKKWPDSPMSSVMDSLIWQALMLENFDFKYESQWEVSAEQARIDLNRSLEKPGNEAFEEFMLAGMIGIESIHTMRREKYLPALQLAFEAMDHAEKSRALAPEFIDLKLADGMYNYWRTVVTMSSSVLPDFGDHRVEGIEQMQDVESRGVFLAPAATLAMVFTWLEEKDNKNALHACLRNQRAYPDNIINNQVLGQTHTSMRRFNNAITVYNRILEVDPKNRRVHYWLGVAQLRSGKVDEAQASLEKYLAFDYLEEWQRAAAHFRMGQVYYRKEDYAKAEDQYKIAYKLNGHKAAKTSLDRMKKRKKEGTIRY